MGHIVYCDDKEKVLEKILNGTKTMVVRGAAGRKIPHSRVFEGEALYFMKKGSAKISVRATVVSTLDLSDIREMVRLLQNASDNINQIARRANETRSVYAADPKLAMAAVIKERALYDG
jgi:hypothetical protein